MSNHYQRLERVASQIYFQAGRRSLARRPVKFCDASDLLVAILLHNELPVVKSLIRNGYREPAARYVADEAMKKTQVPVPAGKGPHYTPAFERSLEEAVMMNDLDNAPGSKVDVRYLIAGVLRSESVLVEEITSRAGTNANKVLRDLSMGSWTPVPVSRRQLLRLER